MANPVMNSQNFQQQMQGGGQAQPGWYQGGTQSAQSPYGQQDPSGRAQAFGAGQAAQDYAHQQSMEDAFRAPAASPEHTGRMTYNDVVGKTGLMLVLVVVAGAVGWFSPGLMIVGAIAGLVLGLVNSFKREPSPVLIMLYALAEGLFLGGISAVFEASYPGIVVQAVLGTLSVFAVMLALYTSGKFRPTPRMTKIVMTAMLGYLVFMLVNLVLTWTGIANLRTGGLGLIIGALAVLLAAYSLTMDFEMAAVGVKNGAPQKYSWSVAFGLTVTLVWLYIEILRILSILRSND
ncbi:Bax inhibitor-1/YccA family protein [Micrococcus luteus]|uniref:Bax inhibitor-1/YccA family protein n=1 Tax=Micrococcus luteus TaxID=1270 RepID=UPI0019D10A08|nr:Bax inhibitor-1/YccA family protein [Micrococcus luteus]MBN6750301.1 Bax inhibitor-1/YccA family protein [Micrococcus luteus]MBN6760307.1 Bax inhibitor-1/YccA family protein [Micrococcus luteus]MBN6801657.1 Bax inhibitor-1/YccA family protein [Micrococcus luteus]MBU8742516.1 Bax inhibitor-1/YccA family protein [Micrococcus luteus]MCC0766923.1 Bax inhibitor-1/YccA family protein [Micrococcus luteus]